MKLVHCLATGEAFRLKAEPAETQTGKLKGIQCLNTLPPELSGRASVMSPKVFIKPRSIKY